MLSDGVSVIICCYNSSLRIEKTLEHLAAQVIDDKNCEIILVDNASSDNTSEIAKSVWSKFQSNKITFKIVSEPQPGLSFARLKGVSASIYEFLILCDDDNWLDKHYVQNVYKLFTEHTDVGILGGFGTAQFEDPLLKPFWFDHFHHSYAVMQHAEPEEKRNNVFGAGMSIRKSVLHEVVEHPMFLSDRKKGQLFAGGDSEICARVKLAGHQILYSPQLKFIHFLTTNRLTWPYLKRLHTGFAKTHVVLNLYNMALNSQNLKLPSFYWLKKALYYFGIYIKYWPKNYLASRKGIGTGEEIHSITWKNIALVYFEYNFKTVKIYQEILTFKKDNELV